MKEFSGLPMHLPAAFVGARSNTVTNEKFSPVKIPKGRIPLEKLALELNPLIDGALVISASFGKLACLM